MSTQRRKVLFLNSREAETISDDKSQWTVRLPNITPMGEQGEIMNVSVGEICIPFASGEAFTGKHWLRLYSTIPMQNMDHSGYTDRIANIPIASNLSSTPGFSYVTYNTNGSEHASSTLMSRTLNTITFTLTDDQDKPVTPADHWFVTVVVTTAEPVQDAAKTQANASSKMVGLLDELVKQGGGKRARFDE